MEKLKIYIESSAVSNLEQPTSPKEQSDMRRLWELIKQDRFDVVISSVVMEELDDIKDSKKREILSDYLDEIEYEFVEYEDHMDPIVDDIIRHGILTENHIEDCQHIACAITKRCDCLVTYNMRHMLKITTVKGVRALSLLHCGIVIDIVKAEALIDIGEEDDT